ncbi:MAG: acyltransferase [Bacteroidia bacterium]|nr:acyltransferase [Bacteroidia bacterium]MCZ2276968.1 acyltransferase [Bacteroidia bacterium]
MLRKLYLSPAGLIISLFQHAFCWWPRPFMIYGYFNGCFGKFKKHTRVSSSVILTNKNRIKIADHVWIGHYCLIDGIGGIEIAEGVHIASHSCIYTHSSHDSIRLLGRKFIEIQAEKRKGYVIKKVSIGEYSFIGTSVVILPGVSIGKGCVIGAGSVIHQNIDDYCIAVGNPAKIIGNTQERDRKLLDKFSASETYYLTKN